MKYTIKRGFFPFKFYDTQKMWKPTWKFYFLGFKIIVYKASFKDMSLITDKDVITGATLRFLSKKVKK